jgi:hypothetical protein
MFSAEEASKPCRERRTLIAREVGFESQRPVGRRKGCRIFVSEGAQHRRGRDFVDLISVNESQTVMGLYGNAVEQVLFRNLQDVFNRAELVAGRTKNRRTNF